MKLILIFIAFILHLANLAMQRPFSQGCLSTRYHDLVLSADIKQIKEELKKPNLGPFACDINSKTVCTTTGREGETALHWIVLYRKKDDWIDTYLLFCNNGADQTIQDHEGSTACELFKIRLRLAKDSSLHDLRLYRTQLIATLANHK